MTQHFSTCRLTSYEILLLSSPNLHVKCCTILNPATLLTLPDKGKLHDCKIETLHFLTKVSWSIRVHLTILDLIFLLMGHPIKMKKGTSNLVMLLLPKSSRPLPGHDHYQRDKLLIFILTVNVLLESFMIWGCYGHKGVFLHPLEPHTKLNNKETFFLLFLYLLKLLWS